MRVLWSLTHAGGPSYWPNKGDATTAQLHAYVQCGGGVSRLTLAAIEHIFFFCFERMACPSYWPNDSPVTRLRT